MLLRDKPLNVNMDLIPAVQDCRYIEAAMENGLTYITVYVPQGQKIGSLAYIYKLRFLTALLQRVQLLRSQLQHVVLLGDFNILPTDLDMFNPNSKDWLTDCMITPEERGWFKDLVATEYTDIYRALHPSVCRFT